MAEYVDRYCAFVDILGFRGLVSQLGNSISKVESLRNTLATVHQQPLQAGPPLFLNTDFRTQSISDALVVSVAANEGALSELIFSLQTLTMRLLVDGYFIRGAVVKGRLYHDDKMAFGEALIRAYQYESTVARYPRIMVLSDVVADTQKLKHLPNVFAPNLKQAEDGPMFIHVLRKMQADMNALSLAPDNYDTNALGEYDRIKKMIEERYREAIDNPRHFEKVQWFARYWNASLPAKTTSYRVLGVGL